MVELAASVLFKVPAGTPDAGHTPLATEIVNGLAIAGAMVAAIVAESTSGTSPVFVIVNVPVTESPGASADQLSDCGPTASAAVPALTIELELAMADELRYA